MTQLAARVHALSPAAQAPEVKQLQLMSALYMCKMQAIFGHKQPWAFIKERRLLSRIMQP